MKTENWKIEDKNWEEETIKRKKENKKEEKDLSIDKKERPREQAKGTSTFSLQLVTHPLLQPKNQIMRGEMKNWFWIDLCFIKSHEVVHERKKYFLKSGDNKWLCEEKLFLVKAVGLC